MATLISFMNLGKSQNSSRKLPDTGGESTPCSSSQFKFTQLWNGIIQYLQENVEVKRRKRNMRSYDSCFTGTDAVEILHHYLEHHGGLEHKVTHENVVKLCQVLMESNVFEAVSCSSTSTKKQVFEDSSSIYYRFIGAIPNKKTATTTPCWCEDQRDPERTPCKQLNTPAVSKKRKRGTSFNFGKHKTESRDDYRKAFTPMERNSKRRNSFGVGRFKAPSEKETSTPFERGKKARSTFAVGRFKSDIRFGETSPETVFERKSLRRSSFGFSKRRQSFRKPETTSKGHVIENPCTMPRADILQNILGQPANVHSDGSSAPKRRRLEEEDVNEIWKEATLQRLLRLIELPYLEDILECTEHFIHDQTPDVSSRNNIYMSVAKRRSPRLAMPECDEWLAAAHDCLEAHPEGRIIIGNYHGNTPASHILVQARKQLLYKTIAKLFTDRETPLIPDKLIHIMTMTVALLARGKTTRAIELTQIVIMLMCAEDRKQLRGLLSFMAEASKEDQVKISFEAFNRMTVIHAFTPPIISSPSLSEIQAKNIVAFMMDCQHKVFKVPEAVKVTALGRIHRIKNGQSDICKVYCGRISNRDFEYQKGEGTRKAMRDMTNSIIDDTRISLKDKKQFLQRFQKHYGDLYQRYFSGML